MRNANVRRHSGRPIGREMQAIGWLFRHPLFLMLPGLVALGVVHLGPAPTGWLLAGLVLAVLVWWRAHPSSFDAWAAPWLRSGWRRWTSYAGWRWAGIAED